jgi:excisionase family DNA binding protein
MTPEQSPKPAPGIVVPRVTPTEVADRLGISPNQARKLIRTGQIHGIKMGKYLRTTWDDVRTYLERDRRTSAD